MTSSTDIATQKVWKRQESGRVLSRNIQNIQSCIFISFGILFQNFAVCVSGMHAWITLGVAELPRNSDRLGPCFDWYASSADQVIADMTQLVVSLPISPILRRSFPDQTLCGCCYVTNALLTITIPFYKTTWFRDGVPWLGGFISMDCTTTKTECMYIHFCFQFLRSADNCKTHILKGILENEDSFLGSCANVHLTTLNHCEYCSTKKIIYDGNSACKPPPQTLVTIGIPKGQKCCQRTQTHLAKHSNSAWYWLMHSIKIC